MISHNSKSLKPPRSSIATFTLLHNGAASSVLGSRGGQKIDQTADRRFEILERSHADGIVAPRPVLGESDEANVERFGQRPRRKFRQDSNSEPLTDQKAHDLEAAHLHAHPHRAAKLARARRQQAVRRSAAFERHEFLVENVGIAQFAPLAEPVPAGKATARRSAE